MALFSNTSRETKIKLVGGLTLILFLMEIIVGYTANSIALIADSFHMLSDLVALCVAFYAIGLSNRKTKQSNLSFGYQRAEILGAFANAIFLLALCFTITVEAVQRFVNPVDIEDPKTVLIAGCVGLTSNVLGMFLFGGHVGHNHRDHGNANHDHSHSQPHERSLHENTGIESVPMNYRAKARDDVLAAAEKLHHSSPSVHYVAGEPPGGSESHAVDINDHENSGKHSDDCHMGHPKETSNNPGHNHGNMNMQGLFLHALGDALGSVGVILSALIIMYADGSWRFYMDPIISLLISGLIIASAIPLVRSASYVLLQGAPRHVSMKTLEAGILSLPGVQGIHEFHVWGLSDNKTVASVHVRVQEDGPSYMDIASSIKKLLHGGGIHSTTVQPEFLKRGVVNTGDSEETTCLLMCKDNSCIDQLCCPDNVPDVFRSRQDEFLVSEPVVDAGETHHNHGGEHSHRH
ncbi:cation efflux protein [Obelidium mucronatum]|nr:cation efflux protein [Obelidium mucronatum]